MFVAEIRGTKDFVVPMQEERAEDVLGRLEPPIEAERALAKLALQRKFEEFSEKQHIRCASPPPYGNSWFGMIKRERRDRFGDLDGFNPAGYEIEAICSDTDELIWGEV